MKNLTTFSSIHLLPFLLAAILLLAGCSGNAPTDEELLQRDQERLEENLNGVLLDYYKFLKVSFRVMPVLDTSKAEHRKIKELNERIFPGLFDESSDITYVSHDSEGDITFHDVKEFISAYISLRKFASNHDEDEFPTLLEGKAMLSGDSVRAFINGQFVKTKPPLQGEAKANIQSFEHTLFSAFMMVDRPKVFTKSILLYECSKSNMDILAGNDMKVWLQMVRGLLYFDQGFMYLSEKEYSENLDWLYENPHEMLPTTSLIFFWSPLFIDQIKHDVQVVPNDVAHTGLLLTNHTLRAMTRLSMNREIDEERAMADFEAIVNTAQSAGLQNEIIWSIEAYLYMHQEKSDEAILSLKKLRRSEFLSDDERKTIDESIGYLENREAGSALNGVFDKYFLNKLLIKYLYKKSESLDWISVLKELGAIKDNDLIESSKSINDLLGKVEEQTSTETLKKKGTELKEEGEKLLKDIWN